LTSVIERRDLFRIFQDVEDSRVIFVGAPAGYGKTLAVTRWLEHTSRARAIFSADEYDNSVGVFCERVCAALFTCQPRNEILCEICSHSDFGNAPEKTVLKAISALAVKKKSVIGIDDFHLINSPAVLEFIRILINRLPENFQMVLISRHKLPQCFSDLRLKGQIAAIGAEELRFSLREVNALCKTQGIGREQAEEIYKQSHGWAIAVSAFLDENKNDHLNEFIQKNIWEICGTAAQEFMLRTAFLQELTPPLCEEVTGSDMLEELARQGGLITRLQNGAYRWFPVFQEFLQTKAAKRGSEFITPLSEKEAAWHFSQGDFYGAAACFIRTKNHEGIARCYNLLSDCEQKDISIAKLSPILNHAEFITAAKKYPHLLFLTAYAALFDGRAEDLTAIADEYYARHYEISCLHPQYAHEIHYVRLLDFRIPFHKIIMEAEKPDDNIKLYKWYLTLHMPTLRRGIRDYSEMAVSDELYKLLNWKTEKIGWLFGESTALRNEILTAGLLYEQGRLQEAHAHAINANTMPDITSNPEANRNKRLILVRILDAMGETEEADSILQSVAQIVPADDYNFNAFVARREFSPESAGSSENITVAGEWLAKHSYHAPFLWQLHAAFTTCRAYIVTEKYNHAILLLRKILEMAKTFNRPLDILEAQILLSIAYRQTKKGQREALEYLEEAVLTAQPYEYVQMFVNDGAVLSGMLFKILKRAEQREHKSHIPFIKLIRAKIENNPTDAPLPQSEAIKFTEKQMAVMYLLCNGKSQRDIAYQMGIKVSSLRSHLELIYTKLKVTNAADAITQIHAKELLE